MRLLEARSILSESIGTSRIRRTKIQKRSALAGRQSVNLAKSAHSSVYKQYEMKRKAYLIAKLKLQKMYASRAKASARKIMR